MMMGNPTTKQEGGEANTAERIQPVHTNKTPPASADTF